MKQLILTADDFGRSPAVNEAIEQAIEAGVLSQASLMVNEPAADEAVRIAQRHPQLTVGLHLTLCDGRASRASALTDPAGRLPASPALAGLRYFFSPALAGPLREEIQAQFDRFSALGFAPSYWDGHTHLHLHPTVLRHTLPIAAQAGFRFVRLVREPEQITPLTWIFQALSRTAESRLREHGVRSADRVYGLRHTGRMSTEVMRDCLKNLPEGISEIYFHPGAETVPLDYAAMRSGIEGQGIRLVSAMDCGADEGATEA